MVTNSLSFVEKTIVSLEFINVLEIHEWDMELLFWCEWFAAKRNENSGHSLQCPCVAQCDF